MTVEFHPKGLESALQTFPAKRFKNRDGYATFQDEKGFYVGAIIDGPILDVYNAALAYDAAHPTHRVNIYQNDCGHSGVPSHVLTK